MGANRLRVICGPTAAGKSQVAIRLAERHNAAIISADSRQVYRRFDIGTAKAPREVRSRIPHFGVDVADPVERYSAARWATDAREWISRARAGGTVPVVVGGTGLYIRALVSPLFSAPDVDADTRVKLETELSAMSVAELRRWCEELDPARSHLGRTQLLRAIETALLSGHRISDLHSAHRERNDNPSISAHYLVVDPETALTQKIAERFDVMIADGWVDEVAELVRSIPEDALAWKASGYGAIRELVKGRISLSSARERVIIETRQYAKRQRTWFRHQLPLATVTRVNPDGQDAEAIVREWWERTE